MAHLAALRQEACQVPVPASLAKAEQTESQDPKLALPALASKEQAGKRTFWQLDLPERPR